MAQENDELLTEWEKDIKARIENDHTIIMKALKDLNDKADSLLQQMKELKIRLKLLGEALEK